MEREVRYCTTEDGVRIAYCVEGEGPPLLLCPPLLWSFSQYYLEPEIEDFHRQIGAGRMLVHYDMRGAGLSQRDVDDMSLRVQISDVNAVADAARLDRFAIWAPGASAFSAIKYVAENPGRVSALVLYSASGQLLLSSEALRAFEAIALTSWELFCRTVSDMGAARAEAGDGPLRHANALAQSSDAQTRVRLIRQNREVDGEAFLVSDLCTHPGNPQDCRLNYSDCVRPGSGGGDPRR